MPDGQVLEFTRVTKRFNDVTAVSDFSARVEPGVVTAFLGPNGAGKTTTLRILLGQVRPTSGTATIGGIAYADLRTPLRVIGSVLEETVYRPRRTANRQLTIAAKANGIPLSRIDEVLALVGLEGEGEGRIGSFSLGMRQRLSVAHALLGDPGTLVFDEPANGLDPEGIRWMRLLMRRLADEGRTVIVSSHVLSEVEQVADHVLVLSKGQLVLSSGIETLADPSAGSVVVDASDRAALRSALGQAGFEVEVLRSGLTVRGADAGTVGAVAASAGVALSTLVQRGPTLEDVFIELVRGGSLTPGAQAVASQLVLPGAPEPTSPADEHSGAPADIVPGAAIASDTAAVSDGEPTADVPADDAPTEDALVEEAPAEDSVDAPADVDAPTEDALVEETPAEETPAEAAPIEDADEEASLGEAVSGEASLDDLFAEEPAPVDAPEEETAAREASPEGDADQGDQAPSDDSSAAEDAAEETPADDASVEETAEAGTADGSSDEGSADGASDDGDSAGPSFDDILFGTGAVAEDGHAGPSSAEAPVVESESDTEHAGVEVFSELTPSDEDEDPRSAAVSSMLAAAARAYYEDEPRDYPLSDGSPAEAEAEPSDAVTDDTAAATDDTAIIDAVPLSPEGEDVRTDDDHGHDEHGHDEHTHDEHRHDEHEHSHDEHPHEGGEHSH